MDKKSDTPDLYKHQNEEAEKLTQELQSPLGAQKLGDNAFETAKEEAAQKGLDI